AGGGAAASEGLGAPVKAGIAAGVVAVAAAAVALALVGNGSPAKKPEAKPPATSPTVEAPQPQPTPTPAPSKKPAPGAPVVASAPKPSPPPTPRATAESTPEPSPTPTPTPTRAKPKPTPTPTPAPAPTPTPTPPPPPAPIVYQWNELKYGVTGDHTKPEMRLGESSWVWQRWGVSIAGQWYTHGVTVHGESSVTIDLNRSCSAYDALVGVDDLTLGLGQVSFSVYADGARLWQSPLIKGGEPAIPVHVNLTGRKTVRLAVEPHTRFDAAALADWAESKFQCQ
ncbi:NPCBM/NEW2 domain-containing protein, partial [Streptomyces mirabilis]|uniref:NPCBM/NEW2 domain-containing protein n=1 Tax=Streptomyces mirabilis TaxID=68239 RepID=UPI00365E86DF